MVPTQGYPGEITPGQTTTALTNLTLVTDVTLDSLTLTASLQGFWVQQIETVISTAFADAVSRVGLNLQEGSLEVFTDFAIDCSEIPKSYHFFCLGRLESGFPMTFSGSTTGKTSLSQ